MLPTVPISPSLSTHADDFVALQPPFDSSQSESTSPSTITVVTEDSVLEDSSSEIAPTTLRQHPEFFLRDPHVTLTVCHLDGHCCVSLTAATTQVENTIFRVHSFFFERESDEARSVLLQTADDGSVVIYGIEAVDLERFLKVLYCKCVRGSAHVDVTFPTTFIQCRRGAGPLHEGRVDVGPRARPSVELRVHPRPGDPKATPHHERRGPDRPVGEVRHRRLEDERLSPDLRARRVAIAGRLPAPRRRGAHQDRAGVARSPVADHRRACGRSRGGRREHLQSFVRGASTYGS
jgi:hypothetical protein